MFGKFGVADGVPTVICPDEEVGQATEGAIEQDTLVDDVGSVLKMLNRDVASSRQRFGSVWIRARQLDDLASPRLERLQVPFLVSLAEVCCPREHGVFDGLDGQGTTEGHVDIAKPAELARGSTRYVAGAEDERGVVAEHGHVRHPLVAPAADCDYAFVTSCSHPQT